jgi:DHA1 family solute carrier family 18 vesicular amine transporter 1/2
MHITGSTVDLARKKNYKAQTRNRSHNKIKMYRIRKFIISIWLILLFCHDTEGRSRHVYYVNKRGGNVLIGSKTIINNNISKSRIIGRTYQNGNNNNNNMIIGDIQTASSSGSILTIRGGGGGGGRDNNRRSQRLTVLLVAIALFNDTLQLTMLLPIIHTLVTSPPPLGVTTNTEVALGIFFASKDICQMIFAPFAAILTSKTSPNIALLVSTIGLGLATLLFAEGTTFIQLLIARASQGAASAAVMCGGMSLIAQTHSSGENRGSAIGLAQTGLALGLLCGPLIGGLLFQKFGRKKTFQCAAIFVMINAVAQIFLMIFAPPTTTTKIVEKQKKKSIVEGVSSLSSGSRSRWMSLLQNNPDILIVAASTLAIHSVVGVIKPLSQVVLDKEFGISMIGRSLIISIATVTYFISTPIAGYWSDRISKSKLVATSLVLMFMASVFFGISLTFVLLWPMNIGVGLIGTSMGVAGAASQALLADIVDRGGNSDSSCNHGEYSMVFALSDVADSLGLILGPIIGLYLSQRFGSSVGPAVMGILCISLVPMVLRMP